MFATKVLFGVLLACMAAATGAHAQRLQTARLLPSECVKKSNFGRSIALSGDTALISTCDGYAYGNLYHGVVWVFRLDPASGTWTEEAKLDPGVGWQDFGSCVLIDGDTALIGAQGEPSGSDTGSVYVFCRDPVSGTWAEEFILLASDRASGDCFGCSLALSEGILLIGAAGDDDNGSKSGSTYAFRYDAVSGAWVEEAKLLSSDGKEYDRFGCAAALAGDTALIGAHLGSPIDPGTGCVYVFRRDPGAGAWTEEAKLLASDGVPGDYFGSSISISGDLALISASRRCDNGWNSGAVYVFRHDPVENTWTEEAKLLASDGAAKDYFGWRLCSRGGTAVIGAIGDDVHGEDTGSAYVFRMDPGTGSWTEEGKLLAAHGSQEDAFGSAVALSDNVVMVGAPYDYAGELFAGSAYVFDLSLAVPSVDIKCNGAETGVVLSTVESAVVTIDVDPGGYEGYPVDVWVLAADDDAKWSSSAGRWWRGWSRVYHTGELSALADTVLDRTLPPGVFDFRLAIEYKKDGHLSVSYVWVHDLVDVTVVP